MLKVTELSHDYRGKEVLEDISFSVPSGMMSLVTGPSGSGKSVLLRLLGGLEKVKAGEVHFGKEYLSRLSQARRARFRSKSGLIPQDVTLIEGASMLDNIIQPLLILGLKDSEVHKRARRVMEVLNLSPFRTQDVSTLPRGIRQKTMIARALIHEPLLVLADEPTQNLDETDAREVLKLLSRFVDAGAIVILATKNASLAHLLERPVLALKDGRVASVDGLLRAAL